MPDAWEQDTLRCESLERDMLRCFPLLSSREDGLLQKNLSLDRALYMAVADYAQDLTRGSWLAGPTCCETGCI